MCTQLVKLAFEAAPALRGTNGNGNGDPASSPLLALLRRYVEAAREDVGKAAVEERAALDRLITAEQRRLDAKQADDTAAVERSEANVAAARARSEDATLRHNQAQSDSAFAEARMARSESALRRRPRLTGRALRTFAVERIRQLDEIAQGWGPRPPSRDRILIEDLRGRFRALSVAKAGA